MLKGFKEFIMRGNVIDLAVAVVIGAAFAAVVNTVVTSLITPILNAIGGGQVGGLKLPLRGAARPDAMIDFAAIINSVIVFLITAAVVYLIFVAPMNKINERRMRGQETPAEVSEELATLREIRDLLATRGPGTTL
jgi:large conductance mechanosensitive channel